MSQPKAKPAASTPRKSRWSAKVTKTSDALDLEEGVFKRGPKAVARSLKRSAERSSRRKSSPYRSAMSMLTFYMNRAGKHLSARQKDVLQRAKEELRKLFDEEAPAVPATTKAKADPHKAKRPSSKHKARIRTNADALP